MTTSTRGAGGTPGGLGEFLLGLGLVVGGGYLVLNQVSVGGGTWNFYGYNAFGLSLIPLLLGIGLLFFNGKSVFGWVLTGAGAIIIVVGVIANLQIFFRPTSLFNTLLMLGLLAAGIGLVAKSLRSH
ncbi:MAG: hypothetical protein ACKVZ0_01800 [Gemmatimonadales bacterium]